MPARKRKIPVSSQSSEDPVAPATKGEQTRAAIIKAAYALFLKKGFHATSVREIAEHNIYQATALAMRRALGRLSVRPDVVLVDGKPIRTLGVPHRAFVGGDSRIYVIACASIVAKVARDRLMRSLSARYPSYGWEANAGYGTPVHLAALRSMGMTAHHRALFCRGVLAGE